MPTYDKRRAYYINNTPTPLLRRLFDTPVSWVVLTTHDSTVGLGFLARAEDSI